MPSSKSKSKAPEPFLGSSTLPRLWIYICMAFNLIGIGAALMLIVAELVLLVNNYDAYVDQLGYSYRSSGV